MINIDLLGPLEVRRGGVDVTPSAPKLRRVLAALVLNTNLLVSVGQLFEELWDGRPPPSAVTTMQTYIYQLRRRLHLAMENTAPERVGHPPPPREPSLLTRVGGYELRLEDPDAVDVRRFDRLVARGRTELEAGELHRAVRSLGDALDVWRGPALVDVTAGRRLSVWVTELEEKRKSVQEWRFGALLEMGRHHVLVDELASVNRAHPTHEGFASQLMLALHRCGRRPEALDVFRRVRTQLVEELGLEPSATLQRLQQGILMDDPHLTRGVRRRPVVTGSAAAVPAQLPPATPDFVGYDQQLGRAEKLLTGARDTAPLIEVHGRPGAGKTTLAVQLAHRVRAHYPDGQLYLNLAGVTAHETQLVDVLTACLRSCGLPRTDLPERVDELSRTLRSLTADRRMLIVVDDVANAAHLRPLLPGGAGCAVIATNRRHGDRLPGAHAITLPALTMDECLRLFASVAGGWRVEDEPGAVAELVRMAGMLPLTVRGVAARLASRPGWTAARLLERLRFDEWALLDLAAGPNGLVNTVAVSYRNLRPGDRRALRVIAVEGPRRWTAAELADVVGGTARDADALIEQLVDAHLLAETAAGPDDAAGPAPAEPTYVIPRLTSLALVSMVRAEHVVQPEPEPVPLVHHGQFRRTRQEVSRYSA